jgi:hypothetical protein
LHFHEQLKTLTGYGRVSYSPVHRLFRRLYAWVRYLGWASGLLPLARIIKRSMKKLARFLRPRASV